MAVVTPTMVARVSLPEKEKGMPLGTLLCPQADIDAIKRPGPESDEIVTLPVGEPAVTGPHYLVPKVDECFPTPDMQTHEFTVNGDLLRKLLTVACEVCDDSDKTMRLRFCQASNSLRIDTYRQPGQQEFVGVIKGMNYKGKYIPGDQDADAPV